MNIDVLDIFREISSIPRCSKKEKGIRNWLIELSKKNKFEYNTDEAGNVVIYAEGRGSSLETLIIQCHMDMVCEKNSSSSHDFSIDGINVIEKDGWLISSSGTSLGADNGVGMALGLALILNDVQRPPLELLFTSDEETGLNGAKELDSVMLSGRRMINLDSEDEGIFITGCAGGQDYLIYSKMEMDLVSSGLNLFKIEITGLKGGHSGIDINKDRLNAIRVMSEFLISLDLDIKLLEINGGTAHNAIPRNCSVVIGIPIDILNRFYNDFNTVSSKLYDKYNLVHENMVFEISPVYDNYSHYIKNWQSVLSFLLELPNGVIDYIHGLDGVVETSLNLSKISFILENQFVNVIISVRSSNMSKLEIVADRVISIAEKYGMKHYNICKYPAWEPSAESDLLKNAINCFEDFYGNKPKIEVIHAGLECGIIKEKIKDLDVISFGPNIKYPHSPDEKLETASFYRIYEFLKLLLAKYL